MLIAAAGLALGLLSVPAQAADMSFRWVTYGSAAECGRSCPRIIEAQGTITRETPQAFSEFIRRSGGTPGARRAVLIHSPGGLLRAGMELGLLFRRLNMAVFVGRFADMNTLVEAGLIDQAAAGRLAARGAGGDRAVSGACVSACVYAFMGGTERVVPDRSRLGVHRPYRPTDRYEGSPTTDRSALVAWDRRSIEQWQRSYIATMGVDPALVAVEQGVSSERIRFLTAQEMRRLRITTRS